MTQSILQQKNEAPVPFVMELYAQKARLLLTGASELLSSGMTGVIQVTFTFSEDWEGLKKTAVFSNGAVSIDVPEENWEENVCTVPQQVLAAAGKTLIVGLYGTDGEELVLPTVWCSLGRVESGAAPSGIEAMPPEAPIWARLQKRLGQVEETAPLMVRVLSMTPGQDRSSIVSLDHRFDEIEAACREGRLVSMEMFGAVFPLTRLISGSSAEFTGPSFISGENTYYNHCVVPKVGTAVLTAQPVVRDLTEAVNTALAQAKASGEFDGAAGPQGEKGDPGAQGPQGPKGDAGVAGMDGGYYSIFMARTGEASMRVTFVPSKPGMETIPDQSIALPAGPQGDTGPQGPTGPAGQRGVGLLAITTAPSSYTTAVNGLTPTYRIALSTVKSQACVTEVLAGDTLRYSYYHYPVIYVDASYVYCRARVSIRGASGAAGYTPQKGVDYWTAADQESMLQQVITALGTPVFGQVDANNNIILTGALAYGTYTLKYEDAQGALTTIGTLTTQAGPAYTNRLPLATDASGNIYGDDHNSDGTKDGYKLGVRISSTDGTTEKTADGFYLTGYIPIPLNGVVRFDGINIGGTSYGDTVYIYDSNKNFLGSPSARYFIDADRGATAVYSGGYLKQFTAVPNIMRSNPVYAGGYMRFGAVAINSDAVITVNEEIV